MANEKRLTWKQSIDGYTDVGLREGVTVGDAICKLADLEERDAVEVVHGHWEDGWGEDCYGNIAYKSIDCSECHEIFKIESHDREYWKNRFKVCPFCGAIMDGDGNG
jgi:hypothetical protein